MQVQQFHVFSNPYHIKSRLSKYQTISLGEKELSENILGMRSEAQRWSKKPDKVEWKLAKGMIFVLRNWRHLQMSSS